MAMITRFRIEDLQGRVWDGNEFTRDDYAVAEFTTGDEAWDVADRLNADGFVCDVTQYQRFSRYGDPVMEIQVQQGME